MFTECLVFDFTCIDASHGPATMDDPAQAHFRRCKKKKGDHQPRLAVLVEEHEPGRPGLPVVRPGRRRRTCVKRPHQHWQIKLSTQHFILPAAHWASRKTGTGEQKTLAHSSKVAWGRLPGGGCWAPGCHGLLWVCQGCGLLPVLHPTTTTASQSTVHKSIVHTVHSPQSVSTQSGEANLPRGSHGRPSLAPRRQ